MPTNVASPLPRVDVGAAQLVQGGYLIGQAPLGSEILLDGTPIVSAPDGHFLVGFDRDAGPAATLSVSFERQPLFQRTFDIAPRDFPFQRVTVPRGRGDPLFSPEWYDLSDPAIVEMWRRSMVGVRAASDADVDRASQELALKKAAYASVAAASDFKAPWAAPVRGRVTSLWGARRVLVTPGGERPPQTHCGVDIAAFSGTPITAPAGGLVVLAQPDLTFEGGCAFVDHGTGLISAYLHMSAVAVTTGQRLVAGDLVGEVGATGRASGPHLCWRMKWKDRHLDPTLWIGGASSLAPSAG